MGKKGRRERKKEGEGRCAPAATATAVGHAWRAAAEGGARGRREKGERKKKGGICGGRSRRVALDGKEMRRGLNSGVGSDLRGSGDRSRRVSGKLGLGFEERSSSTTRNKILAHNLF